MTEKVGLLVSVHCIGCSLPNPYGFANMARPHITLFAENLGILPIDDMIVLHRMGTKCWHTKDTQKLEASKQNFTRQARKESQSEQSKSAVADHAVQNNHVINWQDAKVLCKECNMRSRHIRESIWIRKRAPNTMNRDEGAHFLSHIYDPLLTSSSSTRTPSTGRRQSVKLDQLWRSTLPSVYHTVKRKSIFGFEEWTLFI